MHINKQEQYTRERYDAALGTAGTFMSNFFQLSMPIMWGGYTFHNSEGIYMAMRTDNEQIKKEIAALSLKGGKGSRSARYKYSLEMDEEKRAEYMLEVITLKFTKSSLLPQLLATGEQEIIEKNYWKDSLFGVREDTLMGANILGKCLMQVRKQLKT